MLPLRWEDRMENQTIVVFFVGMIVGSLNLALAIVLWESLS